MELKLKKINVKTDFYDFVNFELLNYDELPHKFISQTNLYKGDNYNRPNTEGAPIYITDTSEIGIYNAYRGEDEIRPCVALVFHNWCDTSDWGEEIPWYEDYKNYKEIKFDPFTGEEIKITIVEEQDVSEEVEKLEKEFNEISDKLRKINYDEINALKNRQLEIEQEISNFLGKNM